MLNILFNARKAERHPLEMMLIGFVYSSLSIFISLWIFPDYSSLTMVFFTVFSCLYVVQGAIKLEEKKLEDYNTETWTLKHHIKPLLFILFLFLGFVFSFAFWAFVFPPAKSAVLFSLQASIVEEIRALSVTGNVFSQSPFLVILENNLNVLFISLIFAFFYGAGAIFIIAWNASVMGFVIGELARSTLGIASLPIAFTKYFLHGIPEMIAYLIAAFAGGLLYIAVLRGDLLTKGKTKRIILDTIILILISVLFLVFAALIEIYISPSV